MTAESFRAQLLDAGVLVDAGVPGLYHRSHDYETVLRSFEAVVTATGRSDRPRRLFFSPVIDRSTLEDSGYVSSFPNLIGTISSFDGDQRQLMEVRRRVESGGDWEELMSPASVSLCSSACHPLYPLYAGDTVPAEGLNFEVQSFCFRHEPSSDPARMQSFRQQEFVYIGTPEGALTFRDRWLDQGCKLLTSLGLDLEVIPASDPFFGRGHELMSMSQIEKALKFEITTTISSSSPGAVSSVNYHEDHFGATHGIRLEDGSTAHSSCIGFGLDRITLALYFAYGLRVGEWPDDVLGGLSLSRDQVSG